MDDVSSHEWEASSLAWLAAADAGDTATLRTMLTQNSEFDPLVFDHRLESAIEHVAFSANMECLDFLLVQGHCPHDRAQRDIMIAAVSSASLPVVDRLLEQDWMMSPASTAALCWALAIKSEALIDRLLEWGAPINARDPGGNRQPHNALTRTPLIAAVVSSPDRVACLLQAGADPNFLVEEPTLTTVFHEACSILGVNIPTLRHLVAAGADVHARKYVGTTPLLSAVQYDNAKVVEYLYRECGADLYAKDNDGNGFEEIIQRASARRPLDRVTARIARLQAEDRLVQMEHSTNPASSQTIRTRL